MSDRNGFGRLWSIRRGASRHFAFIVLSFAVASATAHAPVSAAAGEEPLTLDRVIALALASNRDLRAARIEAAVSAARAGTARELPNPEIAIEGTKETPKYAAILSLPIEMAGKRGRRIDLAEAESASVESEIARMAAATRNTARRRFYALLAAQARVEGTGELLALAQRMRDAARERFESGSAARLESLQAGLAADQAEIDNKAAVDMMRSAVVELNTLLARPPDSPVNVTGSLDDDEVPAAEDALDLSQASSVVLAAFDHEIMAQRARIDLAKAERFPDPVVSAGVAYDSPPEFTWGWRGGVSIALPVFTTHRAAQATEEAALMKLEAEREALAARIRGGVYSAVLEAASRREQLAGYRDRILPDTEEVEGMAEESYRAGQTSLVSMLQTFQAVADIRLRAIQAGLDYQTALADLEEAMGVPLP